MDLNEDDGAILLYRRGTQGELNGALFSHHNVAQTSRNIDTITMTDASTNEFVLLALEESTGFMRICSLLFAGSTVVLADGSGDQAAAHRMLIEKCTALSADVTTFGSFIDDDHSPLRNPGIQLTSVHLGGTDVPFLFKKRKLIHDFPNAHIYLHFGTAEAPFTTCIEVNREREKLDSIGQPTPHTEISIIDDKGQTIDREEIGEILVRGDQVMQQYWRRLDLNRQVFHEGGWLRSGIIGYCDKEGYVHFLGPKSEIINTPGHVIFPFEVEEAIHEYYPDCEICVVGVPDPSVQGGDILILCYRSNSGRSIIPAELLSALAYRLDKGKIPRIVYRMDEMPRSNDTFGRQELRRRIVEGVAASTPNAP
jgi:acyl-CoA synthetase (AMP-forming)/AMP-acid ligase II